MDGEIDMLCGNQESPDALHKFYHTRNKAACKYVITCFGNINQKKQPHVCREKAKDVPESHLVVDHLIESSRIEC